MEESLLATDVEANLAIDLVVMSPLSDIVVFHKFDTVDVSSRDTVAVSIVLEDLQYEV